MPLIFTDKSEIKEIEVTWKEGVTTKFTVALGENARFQRKVEFWTSKLEHTELVFDGDTLTGPEKAPTGSKADQVFTDWSLDGKPYDLNTKVTANMRLEAIFKLAPIMTFASPLGEPKIGEELEITLPITPKDFVGKDITLDINIASAIATSTRTYTTIEYDENNYIKALVNGEWKDAKDIPIKLEESNQSVTFKIKITDKIAGNGVFYLCYDMKHNNEKIYTGLSSKKYLLTEDTAVVQGPMGYFKALSKITGKDGEFRLAKDTTLTSTLEFKSVNKRTITLDLNGHTLTGPNKTVATGKESLNDVIKVMYANDVTIKNSKNAGKIVANKSGAGVQIGTATGSGTHVTIEDGVEIESVVYGIGIAGKNTVLDFKGKITLTGTEGSGYAISGNGTNEEQYTIINIYPTAIIDAQNKNLAFYLPQMGELNILGGNITASTVIGVKSGKVNISGGTLTANGEAFNPALTGNGTITTGNVIYAEVNDSYAKNIEITITGGTLSSTNGNIIQVYKSNSTDNVTVNSSYTSEVDQNDTNIIRYN